MNGTATARSRHAPIACGASARRWPPSSRAKAARRLSSLEHGQGPDPLWADLGDLDVFDALRQSIPGSPGGARAEEQLPRRAAHGVEQPLLGHAHSRVWGDPGRAGVRLETLTPPRTRPTKQPPIGAGPSRPSAWYHWHTHLPIPTTPTSPTPPPPASHPPTPTPRPP